MKALNTKWDYPSEMNYRCCMLYLSRVNDKMKVRVWSRTVSEPIGGMRDKRTYAIQNVFVNEDGYEH